MVFVEGYRPSEFIPTFSCSIRHQGHVSFEKRLSRTYHPEGRACPLVRVNLPGGMYSIQYTCRYERERVVRSGPNQVCKDIMKQLGFRKGSRVLKTSFDRPEIHLSVRYKV